jgi:hypothetical protein
VLRTSDERIGCIPIEPYIHNYSAWCGCRSAHLTMPGTPATCCLAKTGARPAASRAAAALARGRGRSGGTPGVVSRRPGGSAHHGDREKAPRATRQPRRADPVVRRCDDGLELTSCRQSQSDGISITAHVIRLAYRPARARRKASSNGRRRSGLSSNSANCRARTRTRLTSRSCQRSRTMPSMSRRSRGRAAISL